MALTWTFCCLQVHWDNGGNRDHFRFNERSSWGSRKEPFVKLKAEKETAALLSVMPKINTLLSSDLGPAHHVYA